MDIGLNEIKKELQLIQLELQQQNTRLGLIEPHIPCLSPLELPRSSAKYPELPWSSAKYPSPVESSEDYMIESSSLLSFFIML